MALSDILEAQHNYENDLMVVLSYGEDGHVSGFQYAIVNQKHWTFSKENRGLGTHDINKLLIEGRYRPINKRTYKIPFTPSWDYRLSTPGWEIFRSWLITYYDDQHYRTVQSMEKIAGLSYMRDYYEADAGRAEAYKGILTQLQQEISPDFDTLWRWVASQERPIFAYENRHTGYTYKHIGDAFRDYQDMMERKGANT